MEIVIIFFRILFNPVQAKQLFPNPYSISIVLLHPFILLVLHAMVMVYTLSLSNGGGDELINKTR